MVSLVALMSVAYGQQVQLQVEPQALVQGQTGKARVLVVASSRGGARVNATVPPTLPSESGLQVNYHGQAQHFRNVNGRITNIHIFDYRLSAIEDGTWTLGPVEVTLTDGTVLAADALEVEVSARSDAERASVSVSAGFNVEKAWEGQVVLYHYRFRSTLPGASAEWRLPAFDGLRVPQHGQPTNSMYTVDDPLGPITVQEGVVPLIATGTGKRDQGQAIANVKIPEGRPRPFSFRPVRVEPWSTETAALEVAPLPDPPASFSGLVGNFQVLSSVDRSEAAVGQSITWTLRIQGDGSLEGFSLPTYEADGVSIYENDAVIGARVEPSGYVAGASFARVIVPTEEGELTLPPFELVTFSPSKNAYHTHRVSLPPITVRPGREGNGKVTSFARPLQDAAVMDVADAAPRAIVGSGLAFYWPWGRWLPWLLALLASPGVSLLAWDAGQRLHARWQERRRAQAAPKTATDMVHDLPQDPDARLATLDMALRLALEATASQADPSLRELRARLQRARFAEDEVPIELEHEIQAAIERAGAGGAT